MSAYGRCPPREGEKKPKYFKALRPLVTVLSIKGLSGIGGAGYGLELPCEFKFQGDKFSGDWLKEKLKNENFDVL